MLDRVGTGTCTYQDYSYCRYLYFTTVLSQGLQLKSSLSLSIILTEYKILSPTQQEIFSSVLPQTWALLPARCVAREPGAAAWMIAGVVCPSHARLSAVVAGERSWSSMKGWWPLIAFPICGCQNSHLGYGCYVMCCIEPHESRLRGACNIWNTLNAFAYSGGWYFT